MVEPGCKNVTEVNPGGIDVNPDHMKFTDLKHDGKGVVLPFSQQDVAQLNQITGFDPEILQIVPVVKPLPIMSELQEKFVNV